MKKLILSFIATIVCLTIHGQSLPTPKEQYDFLKWVIKTQDLRYIISEADLITTSDMDSGDKKTLSYLKVNKEERAYFTKQSRYNAAHRMLDSTMMTGIRLQSKPDEADQFTRISMPVFSRNKRMMFIKYEYWTGVSGRSGISIFLTDKNGKWFHSDIQAFQEIFTIE